MARVAIIARDRRVHAYLHTQVAIGPIAEKPTLTWHFDQGAISISVSSIY
ncbi:hypothetical protein ACGFNP_11020 [Nonomuraea sp. NPDC049269]